jgi:hypothetical protein
MLAKKLMQRKKQFRTKNFQPLGQRQSSKLNPNKINPKDSMQHWRCSCICENPGKMNRKWHSKSTKAVQPNFSASLAKTKASY